MAQVRHLKSTLEKLVSLGAGDDTRGVPGLKGTMLERGTAS